MNHQMTATRKGYSSKADMFCMDIHGRPLKHEPAAKPSHWADPVVTFTNGQPANGHAHSDRLWEADTDQYKRISQQLFGDQSQLWWDQRTPAQVEMFLREYFDKPALVLVEIQKMYNRSNGGPVWGFSYRN